MSGNQAQAVINADGGSGSGGSGAGSNNGGSSKHITQQQQKMTSTATIVMSGTSTSANAINMVADSSPRESGDDSEDESEILEESPCGRWLKRREEVDQHDIPGISCVHLAMDTEEGVEVVWNEVPYGSIQELKSHEEKFRHLFENLLQLDHQNIVKFHRYWTDTRFSDRPRLIFITEYMSSGSLKQFLKRTKRNAKRLPLEAWRRWCTQILSALSYLHSCTPPLIHGNIICDSIFIQHNGLVKIGTVVPEGFYSYYQRQQQSEGEHVPECVRAGRLSAADDVYAFGMCALEMAALEIQTTAEAFNIDDATILRTINNLENDLQRDLIYKCLRRNSTERPNASELLFHPLLFEVHSLKLQAAHNLLYSPMNRSTYSDTVIDAVMQLYNRPDVVMAYVHWKCTVEEEVAEENPESTEPDASTPEEQTEDQREKRKVQKLVIRELRLSDVPSADKLEKFVEDVKFGVYPLTAFGGKKPPQFRSRITSPEYGNSGNCGSPEPDDIENRRIVNMMCSVKKQKDSSRGVLMNILLRMDDKMNRQLSCEVYENDTALDLTLELVRLGFVHTEDREKLEALLEETLRSTFSEGGAAFGETGTQERTFSAPVNDSSPTNKATINNNTSINNNNNTKMITKTLPANSNMTSLNQMDAAAATASLMLKAQNQKQPQMSSSAVSSNMPSTAATTTSLGIGGTVTVPMVDPLAGHVMYVPHEQIQQQQQQQQQQSSNTSPHLTNTSATSPTAISTNSSSSTSSSTTIN